MHPKGPLISIDGVERKRIKERRLELKMQQDELARLANTTAGTISNLESGRSKQVKRIVYFKVLKVLKLEELKQPTNEAGDLVEQIVEGAAHLTADELRPIAELVKSLAKTRRSGAT
ncbi:MAG: helix-turn-helix transcriptional regulator [Deltaproteobacteria bacterium]|nr:helix-turn-helix transcriptional regulator [Deltaproteobacteria bacterium]